MDMIKVDGHEDAGDDVGGAGSGAGANDLERMPVAEVVRRVHGGEVSGASLSAPVRRRCVSHLTLQGFSGAEVAELMRVCERTVVRDRAAIRRGGAVRPSLTLGDELLGEFQRLTLASVQRLTRLAGDPGSPAYARLWAEDAMGRVYKRFFDTAERMQYLRGGGSRLTYLKNVDPEEGERKYAATRALVRDNAVFVAAMMSEGEREKRLATD